MWVYHFSLTKRCYYQWQRILTNYNIIISDNVFSQTLFSVWVSAYSVCWSAWYGFPWLTSMREVIIWEQTGALIILVHTQTPSYQIHWVVHRGSFRTCLIQQTRDIHPMLVQCWVSVVDDEPTLYKHWVNVSCFLSSSRSFALSVQRQTAVTDD